MPKYHFSQLFGVLRKAAALKIKTVDLPFKFSHAPRSLYTFQFIKGTFEGIVNIQHQFQV
jgi:hypothetical protein